MNYEIYDWIAYYKDGSIRRGGKLIKEGLVRFSLISKDERFKDIYIDVKGELIYFKRVFCSFPNKVDYIIYYVGDKDHLITINTKTGEINGNLDFTS